MNSTTAQYPSTAIRLMVHALLAMALAQAANKFFVADLDSELANGFYARIFQFAGEAPDQYRILPLIPLKWLCDWLAFNHAVLVYNAVLGMAVLELLWLLSKHLKVQWRWGIGFGMAVAYIFFQYTGWRPDTMGLLLLCCCAAYLLQMPLRDATLRLLLYGASIVLLSFSRADIALIYALYATFYRNGSYAIWIPLPIVVQLLLQNVFFPEAQYYTKTIMLLDNLKLHYIIQHPATYLIMATALAFWRPIVGFVRVTIQKNYYFYLLIAGYLLLVLVIGRLNEYRLYLPFLPLLLLFAHGSQPKQGTK